MTRLVLGVMMGILLVACTTNGADTPGGSTTDSPPDAQTAKADLDAAARAVLPALAADIGGRLSGFQAHFTERAKFGIWDYAADGRVTAPPGRMAETLDGVEAVLTRQGYTVERDEAQKRVIGTKGNVRVAVEAGLLSDDRVVSSLNVRLGNIGAITEGAEFAESAPPEDYLTYVK